MNELRVGEHDYQNEHEHEVSEVVRVRGSTDVGDISWIVPTLHLSVTTAPEDTPWHAWPVVACGGMSIGHKGMIHAAKTLAATMVDLFEDPKTREAIQAEFKEQTNGLVYKAYIPNGPPILPSGDQARTAK